MVKQDLAMIAFILDEGEENPNQTKSTLVGEDPALFQEWEYNKHYNYFSLKLKTTSKSITLQLETLVGKI